MDSPEGKSPCTKHCKYDDAGLCRGCFRTKAEVKGWKRLGLAERAAINTRVLPLIRALGKPDKRRRKLDKRIARLERRLAKLKRKRDGV